MALLPLRLHCCRVCHYQLCKVCNLRNFLMLVFNRRHYLVCVCFFSLHSFHSMLSINLLDSTTVIVAVLLKYTCAMNVTWYIQQMDFTIRYCRYSILCLEFELDFTIHTDNGYCYCYCYCRYCRRAMF